MKIPKIVHYTWFSDEPFPEKIKNCMDSWKLHLSDYEFVLWDFDKIKNINNQFLKEAIAEEKWAFASDYVRLYAIYHYGGIYLDTDVIVYKSFDDLLNNQCFIGRENSFHLVGREVVSFLSSHCFGSLPNNKFIKDCLSYYENRHFVLSDNLKQPNELRLDMRLLPYIQAVIAKQYDWDWRYSLNRSYTNNVFTVFESAYFDSPTQLSISYCQHLAVGSWRESRVQQDNINFTFKIKWRFVKVLEFIINKLGYVIIRAK